MREFIEDLCDNVASKKVTKTDKSKGAYVLNAAQRRVLSAAGFEPGEGGDGAANFAIEVVNELESLRLEVSYYNSVRRGAGRLPEARMGRDIVHWMDLGDVLSIANIGNTLFVWKSGRKELPMIEIAGRAAREGDHEALLGKARGLRGRPARQEKTISDFRRNAAIVAGAIARANGSCEMPNCARDTFTRKDGSVFLEVHHIIPLVEGGDDTMLNAAALCPACHREVHYGDKRLALRTALQLAIAKKEAEI